MKSKKKSFWKTTLICAAVLLAAGLPAGYFGAKHYLRQRTFGWRANGIAASKAGDNERASELLARYLQRIPDDPQALACYIKSREAAELPNGGHLTETIRALKILLGIDPDRLDDRRHLLDLYARIQRRPEALDTANAILAKLPNDARTLGIKTEVLAGLHQQREALETAEKWVAAAPDDIHALQARLVARFAAGQPADAILANTRQLQAASPDNPRLQLLLGNACALAGKDAEALQALKAVAAHPTLDPDLAQLLVRQFDSLGASVDAVALLQDLVKRGAGPDIRHLLARHLWEQGSWEQALELLADVDPKDPRSDATLEALRISALVALGKTDDAAAARAALAQRKQALPHAWTLVLQRSNSSAAAPAADRDIVSASRQALLLDPQNPYLLYEMGDAFNRLGEADLACSTWQAAAAQAPGWPLPGTRVIESLLQRGRTDEAFDAAVVLARRNPTNAAALVALARAWEGALNTGRAGRPDDLLKLVNDILAQIPADDPCALIRLRLLARKSDPGAVDAARALLVRTPPPSAQTLIALASVSRTSHLGVEGDCLARAEKAGGITPELALAQAADRLAAGDGAAGLKAFDDMAAKAGKSQDKAWKLARASYLDGAGTALAPQAKTAFLELSKSYPDDAGVQMMAANARSVRTDWSIMPAVIERIRTLSDCAGAQQGLTWRLLQSRLFVQSPRDDGDVAQGALLLNKLITEFPDYPEAHVLLADALLRMNRLEGASDQLAIATRLQPASAGLGLQLAGILVARGDPAEARKEINRLAGANLLYNPADRRQAAAILSRAGDADGSLKLLQQDARTTEPSILLAGVYRQQRQFEKVDSILQDLLAKSPGPGGLDLPAIQFAVDFYLSQGRREDAEKALAKLDTLPESPATEPAGAREMIRGEFYRQSGDLSSAAALYARAVQTAPGNAAAWRTLAALQFSTPAPSAHSTTSSATSATAVALGPDAAWSTLERAAAALPADKGFAALLQNRELLRTSAQDSTLLPEIIQAINEPQPNPVRFDYFKLLAEERDSMDMDRVAARLQQFVEHHPDFLAAQLRLAQVFATMNRTNEALAAAQHAVNAFPASVQPAQLAVEICARSGRWEAMQSAAETWKKRAAGVEGPAVAADIAIARALCGQGKFDEALSQVKPYVAVNARLNGDFVTVYAIALANSRAPGAGPKAAADLLWPSTGQPSGRSIWISVALGIQDSREAAAWLERVQAVMPAADAPSPATGPAEAGTQSGGVTLERVALIEAYDSLGRRPGADPALAQKAAALADELARDPRSSITALIIAADQASRSGDNTHAESYYRRALAIEPRLWFAGNNLAMLILQRNGDATEAARFASAALKASPRTAAIHDTYAQALARSRDFAAAAQSMRTAIQLEPATAKWHVRLASYLAQAGDPIAARDALAALSNARLNTAQLAAADRDTLAELQKQLVSSH